MCTLTFIPRDRGYYLAMNRDEHLTREAASPPDRIDSDAIYPRDGIGGTWVAANRHGISLALLNWYEQNSPAGEKIRSRGEVIPGVIHGTSYDEICDLLRTSTLQGIWPFRLVGIFPQEEKIEEWRWSGIELASISHDWKVQHWFSSGLSDHQARTQRGTVCLDAWKQADTGSLPWLRRLHASHVNGPGPFSLCVHRPDVETLSYTEFICARDIVQCNYFEGSPCQAKSPARTLEIPRSVTPTSSTRSSG